jgi:hypothetical protein
MRLADLITSVVALAACSAESNEQLLSNYEAQTETVCASYGGDEDIYACETDGPHDVQCMNSALVNSDRAEVSFATLGEHMYPVGTYMFTVDDQVKVFWDHPDGDDYDYPWADTTNCTGPFELGSNFASYPGCDGSETAETLIVDGCGSSANPFQVSITGDSPRS